MTGALHLIASVANGLNKAELRILIELAVRVDESPTPRTTASSRDLAECTGLARSSVQLAIDELNRKKIIHTESGTPTNSASHRLTFLAAQDNRTDSLNSGSQVAVTSGQGGPTSEPEVVRNSGLSGLTVGPEVAATPGLGGLEIRPFSAGKSTNSNAPKEYARTRADSIDVDFDKIIDRLQTAEQTNFDTVVFENARQQLASHHAKFAREENRLIGLPDGKITAQFLSIADWPRLQSILFDLASERKEAGHSFGWYVSVALQRIHGISPDRVRAIRMKLKNSPPRRTVEHSFGHNETQSRVNQLADRQTSPLRKSPEVERLQEQIRALACARSM